METLPGSRYDVESKSIIPCDIRFVSRNGYWARDNTFDQAMIRDSLKNYKDLKHIKGSVVLDLGANCGGFTKMALNLGAKKVIAVEPCPYNFDVLKINAHSAFNINSAISEKKENKTNFYYSDSKRSSSSSCTLERRNYSGLSIEVDSLNINEVLKKYKPSVIKMDMEGKEYDILDAMSTVPKYVKEFALEVHRFSQKYTAYIDRFFPEDQWERHSKGSKMFNKIIHCDWIFSSIK